MCIVQFSENRQIKIQGYAMSRQFSRQHCRNKRTFSSNGYYNEILNLNGSIGLGEANTSKELLTKENSLKYYYEILHSNMVNIHESSYLSTKHLNIYSILVQRIMNLPQIEYRILHP